MLVWLQALSGVNCPFGHVGSNAARARTVLDLYMALTGVRYGVVRRDWLHQWRPQRWSLQAQLPRHPVGECL